MEAYEHSPRHAKGGEVGLRDAVGLGKGTRLKPRREGGGLTLRSQCGKNWFQHLRTCFTTKRGLKITQANWRA